MTEFSENVSPNTESKTEVKKVFAPSTMDEILIYLSNTTFSEIKNDPNADKTGQTTGAIGLLKDGIDDLIKSEIDSEVREELEKLSKLIKSSPPFANPAAFIWNFGKFSVSNAVNNFKSQVLGSIGKINIHNRDNPDPIFIEFYKLVRLLLCCLEDDLRLDEKDKDVVQMRFTLIKAKEKEGKKEELDRFVKEFSEVYELIEKKKIFLQRAKEEGDIFSVDVQSIASGSSSEIIEALGQTTPQELILNQVEEVFDNFRERLNEDIINTSEKMLQQEPRRIEQEIAALRERIDNLEFDRVQAEIKAGEVSQNLETKKARLEQLQEELATAKYYEAINKDNSTYGWMRYGLSMLNPYAYSHRPSSEIEKEIAQVNSIYPLAEKGLVKNAGKISKITADILDCEIKIIELKAKLESLPGVNKEDMQDNATPKVSSSNLIETSGLKINEHEETTGVVAQVAAVSSNKTGQDKIQSQGKELELCLGNTSSLLEEVSACRKDPSEEKIDNLVSSIDTYLNKWKSKLFGKIRYHSSIKSLETLKGELRKLVNNQDNQVDHRKVEEKSVEPDISSVQKFIADLCLSHSTRYFIVTRLFLPLAATVAARQLKVNDSITEFSALRSSNNSDLLGEGVALVC